MFDLRLESDKTKRLHFIYQRLLNEPLGLRAGDFAQELEVSTKTIQRDMQELKNYGVVLCGKTYKIDHLALEKNAEEDEKIIASILGELAKNSGQSIYTKAKSFLSRVFGQMNFPIAIGMQNEKLDTQGLKKLRNLQQAIQKKKVVKFCYEGKDFEVKPLKIALFDGFWYLVALDKKQDDLLKKFHFNTIVNLQNSLDGFDISANLEQKIQDIDSIWFHLDNKFCVELWIDKAVKKYFLRKPFFRQISLNEDSDGSVIAQIEVFDKMEVLPVVYGYIPYIKVLSPQWLCDEVAETIKNYAKEIGC